MFFTQLYIQRQSKNLYVHKKMLNEKRKKNVYALFNKKTFLYAGLESK